MSKPLDFELKASSAAIVSARARRLLGSDAFGRIQGLVRNGIRRIKDGLVDSIEPVAWW